MIPISTRAVIESSRYHFRDQKHNQGHYERSQHLDRTIIESCMARTVIRHLERHLRSTFIWTGEI